MRRTAEIAYREYWVIRVVKDSITGKTVTKEIEHETPPTEQDILDVLLNCEQDEFISIEHNYKLY